MEEIFADIYAHQKWGPGSGPGSTPSITVAYRDFLQNFLEWNEVKTVVDLGCGDWAFSRFIDWSGIDYAGLDCVQSLVDANNQEFGKDHIRFIHRDALAEEKFPNRDLLIVKDVLQHWKTAQVLKILPNFRAFRFVLFTNCRADHNHELHHVGSFRPLNMALPPFSLPVATVLRWDTKDTQLWVPQG